MLKSFGNYFFNKFAKGIQENNRAECFRIVVRSLVRLRDNDRSGNFEIFGPVS